MAGRLQLDIIEFDLCSLLEDLSTTLALDAQKKGLELLCDVRRGVPVLVRGDPRRLARIITNFVGNAVKFTHSGEVVIRVGVDDQGEGGNHPTDQTLLRFSVRDTGIPSDKIGLLFQKFSQVDASTTRKSGGTGLGLAICKQLAGLKQRCSRWSCMIARLRGQLRIPSFKTHRSRSTNWRDSSTSGT